MRIKYLLISMALLPIIITPGFTQNKEKSSIRVHKIAVKNRIGYSDWQKSPLNPLVNSEPYWSVNKWPPQDTETSNQEVRVWVIPANQKNMEAEDEGTKDEEYHLKFSEPHIETIND